MAATTVRVCPPQTKKILSLLTGEDDNDFDFYGFLINGVKTKKNPEIIQQKTTYWNGDIGRIMWTIHLKYTVAEWDRIVELSENKELALHCCFIDADRHYNQIPVCKLSIKEGHMLWTSSVEELLGETRFYFMRAEAITTHSKDKVAVTVRLLESGYYPLCIYSIMK